MTQVCFYIGSSLGSYGALNHTRRYLRARKKFDSFRNVQQMILQGLCDQGQLRYLFHYSVLID